MKADVHNLKNDHFKWPTLLTEVVDVVANELKKLGYDEEDSIQKAKKITFAISSYFGGKSFYLPAGEPLKRALRDYEIYRSFDGKNIDQLIRKFRLSQTTIYTIIRQQRKIQKESTNKKNTLHQG